MTRLLWSCTGKIRFNLGNAAAKRWKLIILFLSLLRQGTADRLPVPCISLGQFYFKARSCCLHELRGLPSLNTLWLTSLRNHSQGCFKEIKANLTNKFVNVTSTQTPWKLYVACLFRVFLVPLWKAIDSNGIYLKGKVFVLFVVTYHLFCVML